MNKKLESKFNHGFSIVEVLVSLLIIMILMLGIYSLVILSLNLNAENANYVQAMEIANQMGMVVILLLVGLTLFNDISRML